MIRKIECPASRSMLRELLPRITALPYNCVGCRRGHVNTDSPLSAGRNRQRQGVSHSATVDKLVGVAAVRASSEQAAVLWAAVHNAM